MDGVGEEEEAGKDWVKIGIILHFREIPCSFCVRNNGRSFANRRN